MKSLSVPFIDQSESSEELALAFQLLPANKIDQVSWSAFPYLPDVSFKIAYTSQSLILEYEVKEKHLKAIYLKSNDPVYKDSCVEFFLSFDGVHYYNFEFNSIGTGLVGYGTKDRTSRQRLTAESIEKIKTSGKIKTSEKPGIDHEWTLKIQIPLTLFKESIKDLKGMRATANFYKCGDDLPDPHFVSWNKINIPEPNFHRPDFFGNIEFI